MQTPRAGMDRARGTMDPMRRGNYDSGQDYVLARLEPTELEDLVNLAVNGEIQDPASGLGEHVNDCWPEMVGPPDRSLVPWLRRLVFRPGRLHQRGQEGELGVRVYGT